MSLKSQTTTWGQRTWRSDWKNIVVWKKKNRYVFLSSFRFVWNLDFAERNFDQENSSDSETMIAMPENIVQNDSISVVHKSDGWSSMSEVAVKLVCLTRECRYLRGQQQLCFQHRSTKQNQPKTFIVKVWFCFRFESNLSFAFVIFQRKAEGWKKMKTKWFLHFERFRKSSNLSENSDFYFAHLENFVPNRVENRRSKFVDSNCSL